MLRNIVMASAAMLAVAPAAMAQQSCTPPALALTVDMVPVAGSDQVTVPVKINGTEKQFLLDIGTDHTEISAVAAAELHLPSGNQSSDSMALAPGVDPSGNQFHNFNQNTTISAAMQDIGGSRNPQDFAPRVRAATFEIGGVTGKSMQLVVANDKEMGKTKPWNGRMTGDMFAQYDIDFDFAGKKLSFMTASTCTEKEIVTWATTVVAIIPMKLVNGKMTVPVSVQGKTVDAVIDTGSTQTVMRRDIAESIGLKADTPDMMPDGDVRDGMGQPVYKHTFSEIAFSGVTAANVPVRIQTNSMVHPINRTPVLGSRAQFAADPATKVAPLAIGMDVLHQLHIYAAFGQDKLYVTLASPSVAPATTK
jgi:hypothetical protein